MSLPPKPKGGAPSSVTSESATRPATPADLYTMAEAARLKGVSYHTVSRAVRRGKLPVKRLGRMALIDGEDLRAWAPMRERAPLKYRRREPQAAAPAMLDMASRDRVELAGRLSTLYQVLHGAAGSLPLSEFLDLLSDRLAEALDFRRVSIWSIALDPNVAERHASFGGALAALPDRVILSETPVLDHLLRLSGPTVIDDASAMLDGGEAVFSGLKNLFAVPLRANGQPLGVLLGDCAGEAFQLSDDQLALARILTSQAALALDHARLRDRDDARNQHLIEALDACEAAVARATALADTAIAVNTSDDLASVLESPVARMVQVLGGGSGVLLLLEGDNHLVEQARYPEVSRSPADVKFTLDDLPVTRAVLEGRVPRFWMSEELAPVERECLDGAGSGATIISPLIARDVPLGVIFIDVPASASEPTSEDLTFVALVSGQCAVAIDKARLLAELKAAHSRVMTVIHQLPQAVVFVEAPGGKLALANQAAERLWGQPLGEYVDGPLPLADREGVPFPPGEDPLQWTLRTGRQRVGEVVSVPRPDGSTVTAVVSVAPDRDANDRIAGAVAILQDTAQLQSIDRGKDEFLSIVAHELRNPMTSLRGNMQLLLRRWRKMGDPARREDIERFETIIAQSDRMADLVNRLLDVSRADLGRLDMSVADGDAASIVRGAIAAHQGLSNAHRFIAKAPDRVPVRWDILRIDQVMTNLLGNAMKYTERGDIRVTVQEMPDGFIEIAIADQGPGIPDHAKTHLFDRYYRAPQDEHAGNGGPRGALEGMGIGLYISHKIAQAHGGDLTLQDTPGGGATFVLRLPRQAPERPIEAKSI
ncbi:MAG TPA: ATP-binding protein [Thermomicrobiales bacterium]|nr:ATP-binding protein [Thermomicrobiales bacterium]